MDIEYFRVKNFKGISDLTIDLINKNGNVFPVIMLLGLNESGKTTILEAVSHFVSRDDTLDSVFSKGEKSNNISDIVPLKHLANFTGSTSIEGGVRLSPKDIESIKSFCANKAIDIDINTISKSFYIKKGFRFEDSNQVSTENIWTISFSVFIGKGTKRRAIPANPLPNGATGRDVWREVVNHVRGMIPKVAYFPTFIVDIPDRIYLRKVAGEPESSSYYRSIMQDVLDVEGGGITVEKHIIDRIDDFKKNNGNRFDGQKFSSSPHRRQVNAVFQRISNLISKEIIENWKNIFNRPLNASSLVVSWEVDTQNNDVPYLSIEISDGPDPYKIHERSLGFRWFFAFLLFVKFKQKTDGKTIFLFDEPASNLHAKAQQELLKAFSQVSQHNQLIFSTHSHHMIDPAWLAGAYVIENKAIDYDSSEDDVSQFGRHTDIRAVSYRNFAAQTPSRSSYFQPIIEKLQYVAPVLIGHGPYVLVEGITDYFVFSSVAKNFGRELFVMPGSGAGASGPLISLLLSQGSDFLIILDSDAAGISAKKKYIDRYLLDGESVICVHEVVDGMEGKGLETILDGATKEKIEAEFGEGSSAKKSLRTSLAEAYARGILVDILSDNTKTIVSRILDAGMSRSQKLVAPTT